MKKLRKIVAVLGIVTCITLLVACSTNKQTANSSYEDSTAPTQNSTTEIEEKTIESSVEEAKYDYSGKIITFKPISRTPKNSSDSILEYKFLLEEINANSGVSTTIKEFVTYENLSQSLNKKGGTIRPYFDENTISNRTYFDADFDRLVYTESFADGSVHVGWYDTDGNKTDITNQISNQGGFSDSVPKHYNPRFVGENFYFLDGLDSDSKVMYVPVNNVSLESLAEFVAPEIEFKEKTYSVYPSINGGYTNYEVSINSLTNTITIKVQSEKLLSGAEATDDFVSWLDETHYLTIGTESKNSETQETTSLLPDNSRRNESLIASSDGKEILFNSRLGTDKPEAYIASINGGEPRRLGSYQDSKYGDITEKRHFIQWTVE